MFEKQKEKAAEKIERVVGSKKSNGVNTLDRISDTRMFTLTPVKSLLPVKKMPIAFSTTRTV